MPIDYKKTEKSLYQPKTTPAIIDVPEMIFIAIDGKGDPNTSSEYAAAIEVLYGLSYAIKMSNKAVLEYVVPPLESFWNTVDAPTIDKSRFEWTALIRQPDFVTKETLDTAKTPLAKKKPKLDTSKARLISINEGLCVHAMHIGSYDHEHATIAAMNQYALEQGYSGDLSDHRRHHEIYLSDPCKVSPEKLKTIIRHPITKTPKN